ncbi:MAG: cytidine deaminase [Anaerovoracaceae bacterium]|jgi:cytidine deaminase|nr:cytidine deaminase [Anaerovoracaceae bacterium]
MDNKELYNKAKEATDNAYAPFSKFYVGAALLAKSGEVYTGVNVENSSYGATICAERSAFVKAVTAGEREFEKIAVATREGSAWPCGICRQFMWEFCDQDFLVITGEDGDKLVVKTLGNLFPEGFRLST